MRCLYLENKLIRDRLNLPDAKQLLELHDLAVNEQFGTIKLKLMRMNSIPLENNIANFYGDEFNRIITHLNVLYKSYQMSECSSKHCPQPVRVIESCSPISWMDPNAALEDVIQTYILETGTSACSEIMSTVLIDHR